MRQIKHGYNAQRLITVVSNVLLPIGKIEEEEGWHLFVEKCIE